MSRTKRDQSRRSSERWERGRNAPKAGNPRYRPVLVRVKGTRKRSAHRAIRYKLR